MLVMCPMSATMPFVVLVATMIGMGAMVLVFPVFLGMFFVCILVFGTHNSFFLPGRDFPTTPPCLALAP